MDSVEMDQETTLAHGLHSAEGNDVENAHIKLFKQ